MNQRLKGGNGWQIPWPNRAWIKSSPEVNKYSLICSMTWWKHSSHSPVPLHADMSLIFFGKPLHHCKTSLPPKLWFKESSCAWHKSGCQWLPVDNELFSREKPNVRNKNEKPAFAVESGNPLIRGTLRTKISATHMFQTRHQPSTFKHTSAAWCGWQACPHQLVLITQVWK